MRHRLLVFVVASAVAAAADAPRASQPAGPPPAQRPAPPPVQAPDATPTLRASVEQVVVDVVVTDANGGVVPGLTADDFEIVEDGAAQRILTFSEVTLPVERRAPGSAVPPAEVRSNRAMAQGRVYLLLLDDLFVMASRTPGVQQVARDFIDRYVQPGDLVAVATTGGMAGTSQAFTEDMALVGRAVDRFVGKKVRSAAVDKLNQAYQARELDPMRTRRAGNANSNLFNRDGAVLGVNAIDDELLERGRTTMRTVKHAVQSMATAGGRRKTVVYVSEGIDIQLGAGDTTEIATELQAVLGQAARSNVAIYALSPRGLAGQGDEMTELRALPTGQTGPIGANYTLNDIQKEKRFADTMLRTLADGTGGTAAVDANQLETALERIVAESSHYYLLGYTPPQAKRDGKYRPIAVRVKKPGLHATARKGYTAPDDREAKPEPLKGLPPELGTLLRQPLPSAGLPLAAHAVAFPAATDNVSVTVEVGPGALAFAPKGDKRVNALDVAILPVDAAGRTHGLTQGHPQLTLDPDMAATVAAKGLRLSHRLTLAPGEYQLRIGVRESGGAAGSVLCDLVVPDLTAPGLAMTSIVASTSSALAVPSAYNDPALLWALGGPPTTSRAFDPTDTVSAYVELVDAGATAIRDVDILTVVRDGRGRDVVRSPQPKANGRVAAGKSFAYAVDLPLKALAPGRYVLRIEARASGLAEPLARELIFDVRSPGP
jgi:VWFA-related protein